MTMNIQTARLGSTLKFMYPDNGYHADQALGRALLRVDHVYTLAAISVHPYHTEVYLVEVPGVSFNSVLFEDHNEISRTEIPYRVRQRVSG